MRRLFENVGLRRLEPERERRQRIGDEVEPQELHRRQRAAPPPTRAAPSMVSVSEALVETR